jgi:hypothetical protein
MQHDVCVNVSYLRQAISNLNGCIPCLCHQPLLCFFPLDRQNIYHSVDVCGFQNKVSEFELSDGIECFEGR